MPGAYKSREQLCPMDAAAPDDEARVLLPLPVQPESDRISGMRLPVFFLVAVVASLLAGRWAAADFSALAPCDVMQLSPCARAFAGKGNPTPTCCGRLKAHGPTCLCRYKDDANLKRLVDTRHKRRVFTACKVPLPSC